MKDDVIPSEARNLCGGGAIPPRSLAALGMTCSLAFSAFAEPAIRVNQIGYPADAPKIVAVANTRAANFTVTRDGKAVLQGKLPEPVTDRDSRDAVRHADLSTLSEGKYELRVGSERARVVVANDPYREVLKSAIAAFHSHRCGITCHLTSAFHESSGRRGRANVTGGWHDAGDYGRYVVNSGITTATLLWAWELFGADVLDEARWNVEWMLAMQEADGGVWHKLTPAEFPPFPMRAEDDKSVSLVIGKSSCATANLAAVAAIASRVYREDRYLDAAKHAWAWLEKNPNVVFTNPAGITTGEYGDTDCRDERLWAAAELWRSAGHEGAHEYFKANIDEALGAIAATDPPSWRETGALAAWTYALANESPQIRERTLAAADAIVDRARAHPYRIPLTTANYIWGSNAVAANYALQLLIANELRPDPRYTGAVLDILHYLLGRNTFALSFVTGVGTRSVQKPHHRPSASDNVPGPWPGFLAGGPNAGRQDPALKELPADTPAARMYVDDERSFAGNEVAINWNAPLVFALSGVAPRDYRVVAYVYRRADISRIDPRKLTHINYAFAHVSKEGDIVIDDPAGPDRLRQLVALKAINPKLKILVSVGGWGADNFSDAALTPQSRAKFAATGLAIVKQHGVDGIDLDWEYPGDPGPGIKWRPEDRENFTLMLKAMRQALGDKYLVTIADTAGNYFKRTEMERLHRYLDFINIMTYDLAGSWSQTTGHHAPMFPMVDSFVRQHLAVGIPRRKIVVGVPFYGRAWTEVTAENNGLDQPYAGPVVEFGYARLRADFIDQQGFQRCWDDVAKAPYLWNPHIATFISYEDPVSLRMKADYVKQQRLGGIMYWEHSHDPEERLVNVLHESFER